jgi:uncharacterized protein
MPDDVFASVVQKIHDWCVANQQPKVNILFHGGEPLLVGSTRLDNWCRAIVESLSDVCTVTFQLQTNGVLISDDYVNVFVRHNINVGISMDGPRELHNSSRITHSGAGSYDEVVAGMERIWKGGLPVSVLSVIPLGADGAYVQRHFANLKVSKISYLLPDFTHDTIHDVHSRFGPTPCADFLIDAFESWWNKDTLSILVEPFVGIAKLILGGDSDIDIFGNLPFGFVFVEADGAIEGLDVLRICGNGKSSTGLNVLRDGFQQLDNLEGAHLRAIVESPPLPNGCIGCPEETTCSGGYLPHRWSNERSFDNPSVWCDDLLKLFRHIRTRLEVSPQETLSRRQSLASMAAQ